MVLPRIALLLWLASVSPWARGIIATAPQAPERELFTARVAAMLARQMPGFDVRAPQPLVLQGRRADGVTLEDVNLRRLHAFCLSDAARCGEATRLFVQAVAEKVNERLQPIEPAMVRLVVREQAFMNGLQPHDEGAPAAFYARPLAAGLVIVPVLDYPHSIRFVEAADLQRLHLNEDELFALGRENLRHTLPPLADLLSAKPGDHSGQLTGDEYTASRLLLHSAWQALAERMGRQLMVMVPTDDTLLYGDGSTPEALQQLRERGNAAAREADRPLSTRMLRWTPQGWEATP